MLVAESPPDMVFFTHLDLISTHSLCSRQSKFQFHASKIASVTVYLISAYPIREQIQPFIISFWSIKFKGTA